MKRPRRFFVVVSVLLLLPLAAARADLSGEIRAVLADKLLARGQTGVEVIRLGEQREDCQVIFEHNPAVQRIPASNLKLVTTATALEKLGPDFQFRTELVLRGRDLIIVGDGDPTFGDAELLRRVGWEVDTVFKQWAELLKKRGISEVRDLLVDDSIFDQAFIHPNWPPEQEHKRYVAQVAGMNLNANCLDFYLTPGPEGQVVDFRTDPAANRYATIRNTCISGTRNAVWLSRQPGTNDIVLRGETNAANDEPISVTIHDPPLFAAAVFAQTLQNAGIRMTGSIGRDPAARHAATAPATAVATTVATTGESPVAAIILAVHATPLATVLDRANKDSMNLYAEALCKRIGAAVSGGSGSWENGTAATARFLESIGVAREEFNLDDGCGLSKKNGISPNVLAQVLAHKFYDADRQVFMGSLAVAGVDGTFESRFKDSDLRGRVFGKSGYVSGVSSLSGYLRGRDGQWYAFSILMNGLPEGTNYGAKQLQERIVKAIDSASSGRVVSGR